MPIQLLLPLLLLLLCHGCAPRLGEQGPPRSAAGLAGKFDAFVGQSDRDLAPRLRSGLDLYEVWTKDIRQGADGSKETVLEWSHRYAFVTAYTAERVREVPRHEYGKRGVVRTYYVPERYTETFYTTSYYTRPCQTVFVSRDGIVRSYSSRGEGCVW